MKKIALILSGGGFQGAFQIGALQILRENWHLLGTDKPPLHFDVVSGVSVGALNGLLVSLQKFKDLEEIWHRIAVNGVGEIYKSDIIDTNFDKTTSSPEMKYKMSWNTLKKLFPETTHNLMIKGLFARKSIYTSLEREFKNIKAIADNSPLHELLKIYARKEDMPHCTFKCGFVSLDTGKYHSVSVCDFDTDEDFAKGVLASTSIPIIWPPVDAINVNGETLRQCVDGGVKNVSPLRHVIEEIKDTDTHPEEFAIIIINCSSGKINEEDYSNKSLAQIALRALDEIAVTEIFNNDIRDFLTKNFFVKQLRDRNSFETVYDYDFENHKQGKALHYFNAMVIQPDANELGNPLTANKKQVDYRIAHGRQKAIEALKQWEVQPKFS